MQKKAQVHLIATDNPTPNSLVTKQIISSGTLFHSNHLGSDKLCTDNYLYFTTDEEIKEGDEGQYILHPSTNTILRVKEFLTDGLKCENIDSSIEHGLGMNYKSWRKIIATTNPDLWKNRQFSYGGAYKAAIDTGEDVYDYSYIAKIGADFVIDYVQKEGEITEVMLEYEHPTYPTKPYGYNYIGECPICKRTEEYMGTGDGMCLKCSVLKLRPNGTVIIHPTKKKSYTHKEVEDIAYLAFISGRANTHLDVGEINPFFQEWFKKNYSTEL